MKQQTSDDIARLKVLAATCLRPVGCQDWGRQIRFQARMLYPFQTSFPSGALGESAGHLLTVGKATSDRYMFCKAQPGKLGSRTAGTGSVASHWLNNGTWLGVITQERLSASLTGRCFSCLLHHHPQHTPPPAAAALDSSLVTLLCGFSKLPCGLGHARTRVAEFMNAYAQTREALEWLSMVKYLEIPYMSQSPGSSDTEIRETVLPQP